MPELILDQSFWEHEAAALRDLVGRLMKERDSLKDELRESKLSLKYMCESLRGKLPPQAPAQRAIRSP